MSEMKNSINKDKETEERKYHQADDGITGTQAKTEELSYSNISKKNKVTSMVAMSQKKTVKGAMGTHRTEGAEINNQGTKKMFNDITAENPPNLEKQVDI